ncbi:MAG: exodeoxyribonuclease V subunit beta [Desulfobulbaceae bacterium]
MRPFDPLAISLQGRQLIEAGAGTGKTFSIALLYLRLILEQELAVDDILVVTFTRSATEELRGRIRARLREAEDILENRGNAGDAILPKLIATLPDREAARKRVRAALVRMDEASIHTIHGFCQRMLQDHAFASGVSFGMELLDSEEDLQRDIIRDFWRRRFYTASPAETEWAAATWEKGPDGLATALRGLVSQLEVRCVPEVPEQDIRDLAAATRDLLGRIRESWKSCAGEVEKILLTHPRLRRDAKKGYKEPRVRSALAGLEELLSRDDAVWMLPKETELLAASVMATKLKKGKGEPPDHPFFHLFDELYQASRELARLGRAQVLAAAHRFLQDRLRERKRRAGLLGYNDLLADLERAVRQGESSPLVQRIRERYRVALVDEFQDTDPLQYRIFHALFGSGPRPGLFMIGDPKQSIYSFRGADVFAYIQAARQTPAENGFTMTANYRSTAAMVEAVNRLFDREDSFVVPEIRYHPVESGRDPEEEKLTIDGQEVAPLQAMVLPVEQTATPGQKTISGDNAGRAAARWTAGEIGSLLRQGAENRARIGDRPLAGGDIAVLVRTHREADMVQRELSALGIASVSYRRDSIYATAEAAEVQRLLTALLDLSATRAVNAALATRLFGMSAPDLDQLRSDPAAWDEALALLEEYRRLWRDFGVAPMLHRLIGDREAVGRLASLPGGERRLTNYLHLAELLQEESGSFGMEGLVRRLSQLRGEEEQTDGEARQLRLESDENLVRIVTIHKAKGLEYPVVFLPFIWSGRSVKEDEIFFFHDPDDLSQVADLGTREADNFNLARMERMAENMRMLYVAVTRARYCCYFCWGRIRDIERSGLNRLLHGDTPASSLEEEEIREALERLNDTAPLLGFVPWPEEQQVSYQGRTDEEKPLRAVTFTGHIDTGWTITSYSRLARGSGPEGTGADTFPPLTVRTERGERSVFTFPAGAAAGSCLHGILEEFDFAGGSGETFRELTEANLRRAGFDPAWTDLVTEWLGAVLDTPLLPEPGIRLREVEKKDRLAEMGFYFALRELDTRRLDRLLREHGCGPLHGGAERLSGLMRGFIDLVFRVGNRYFLADYKSNLLGPDPADYRPELLQEAMREHHYDLQYLIYTVALHRFLGARLPGYDYDVHFGGVCYLFLRGMGPDHPPGNGIFHDRPEREFIEALDSCFGVMEER